MAGTPRTEVKEHGFKSEVRALREENNNQITDLEVLRKISKLLLRDRVQPGDAALGGIGLDIDAAGTVPDAETNTAVMVMFNGDPYLFGAQATIDLSAKTCGGDTIADFGVIYVYADLSTATAGTDAETPVTAQGAGITSALLAWGQLPPAPPAAHLCLVGAILLDASSAFTIGTTNLDAATDTYFDFVGVPGVVKVLASLIIAASANKEKFDYGAGSARLGTGTVIALTGETDHALGAGTVADGLFGAWVIWALADDSVVATQVAGNYNSLQAARDGVADMVEHPYLAYIGTIFIENKSGSTFTADTTALDGAGITTTLEIAQDFGASTDLLADLLAATINV